MRTSARPLPAGALLLSLTLGACAGGIGPSTAHPAPPASTAAQPMDGQPVPGLLVMAHGGSDAWNQSVGEAVAPLRGELPTALALGMADPVTLQAALDSLDAAGATDVAVVRLFLSGTSFLHQTEYLFGLRDDPPPHPMLMHGPHGAGELAPLRHDQRILLSREGLSDSPAAANIVASRAEAIDPGHVAPVLVLAHGMGSEEDNRALLADMEAATARLAGMGFTRVRAATLREDWPEARARSEAEIRAWLEEAADAGPEPVVVPYRLSGFGPYAKVLAGLSYQGTEGLLPDPSITGWLRSQAGQLFCRGGVASPLGGCAVARPDAAARR